jgi:hypothetical protein
MAGSGSMTASGPARRTGEMTDHGLSLATILIVFGPMPLLLILVLAGLFRDKRGRR